MAHVVPDGWQALDLVGSAQREIETLRILATLPDGYTVLHGVHWTRIEHGASVYGEIDFIVVAPNGRILVIEQKSGMLDETPDGLVKSYGTLKKRVAPQIMRSIDALMTRFKRGPRTKTAPDTRLAIDYLLYCPDYQVRDATRAGISPERIVDVTRASSLVDIVVDVLVPEPGAGAADASTVLRFLSDELSLVADVATLIGRSDAWVTRLAAGLAQWAMQLEFTPFRLRVQGTAGSGKTQLALRVLAEAAAQGRSALYVCYNRPLADHIARIAPEGAGERILATTFHGLGDRLLREGGHEPDFGAPDLYRRFEEAVAAARPGHERQVDVLIVDEGQDFTSAWRDGVLRFLRPEGRAYWLEDPLQNLYAREPVELPGWVTLRASVNYRSPRDIVAAIVPLLTRGRPQSDDTRALLSIEAASPLAGSELDIATWDESDPETATRALFDVTMRAITRALAAGYKRSDIVVLTFAGREHARLLAPPHAPATLGPHALRRFTGTYDLFGNPDYSEGDVLVETIYRFKGQSAPCVIFSEIDFEALDDKVVRKLFVGATRATTKLMLVMSERAARVCLDGTRPAE